MSVFPRKSARFLLAGSLALLPGWVSLRAEPFPYHLVGVAQFDGIAYANLIDPQTREHFVLSSDRPERGLRLTSVTSDEGPQGATAVITDGESSLVVQRSGSSPAPPQEATMAGTTAPALSLSQPGAAVTTLPTPPPGATLPLIFQQTEKAPSLTEDQQATLDRLRQKFLNAIASTPADNSAAATENTSASANLNAGTSAPTANAQRKRWESARDQSDDEFRMLFGTQAFNLYQMSLH